MDKRAVLDEYDVLCRLVDMCVGEGGVVLDVEPASIVSKFAASAQAASASAGTGKLPEPTLAGAFAFAKEAFAKRILKQ